MDDVDDMHAGQRLGGWSHVGRFHKSSRCAALDIVEPELVGLPGKALELDATRRL